MRDARDNAQKPLFRRHVRRPRLTVLLDEATAQSIILTAPAGYGKTTLAREWLQGREHAAWYRATPASADVGAFSAGLADAVGPVVPGAGERVRQRLRVGDATERLARPLAELLAEDLEAWPAGGIIVLDDYHLMAESAPVETFLDWLLTLAPIRVLVTTRRRPGWATARRFLYDEAYEIGRDQLAMTEEEATRVLEGRSTEAVHALVQQAGGWPAVIGLAALSAELAFPKERASESLYRYFAEEVLRPSRRRCSGSCWRRPCRARSPSAWPRTSSGSTILSPTSSGFATRACCTRSLRASSSSTRSSWTSSAAASRPTTPSASPPSAAWSSTTRGRTPAGRRRSTSPSRPAARTRPPRSSAARPAASSRTARARRWRSGSPPAAPPA